MFVTNTIASASMPFGKLECFGASLTRVNVFTLSEFAFRFDLPYQGHTSWYLFRIVLAKDVDFNSLNEEEVAEAVIEAFDALLCHPEMVRRFGRLTYFKQGSTRSYIRKHTTNLLFTTIKRATESTITSRLAIRDSQAACSHRATLSVTTPPSQVAAPSAHMKETIT